MMGFDIVIVFKELVQTFVKVCTIYGRANIHIILLDRPPETLNENVVGRPSPTIHAYGDFSVFFNVLCP